MDRTIRRAVTLGRGLTSGSDLARMPRTPAAPCQPPSEPPWALRSDLKQVGMSLESDWLHCPRGPEMLMFTPSRPELPRQEGCRQDRSLGLDGDLRLTVMSGHGLEVSALVGVQWVDSGLAPRSPPPDPLPSEMGPEQARKRRSHLCESLESVPWELRCLGCPPAGRAVH